MKEVQVFLVFLTSFSCPYTLLDFEIFMILKDSFLILRAVTS